MWLTFIFTQKNSRVSNTDFGPLTFLDPHIHCFTFVAHIMPYIIYGGTQQDTQKNQGRKKQLIYTHTHHSTYTTLPINKYGDKLWIADGFIVRPELIHYIPFSRELMALLEKRSVYDVLQQNTPLFMYLPQKHSAIHPRF